MVYDTTSPPLGVSSDMICVDFLQVNLGAISLQFYKNQFPSVSFYLSSFFCLTLPN